MTPDERGYIIAKLIPGAKFRGCWYDNSIVWLDERPMPSDEDIQIEYDKWKAEELKKVEDEVARGNFNSLMARGYKHTDGFTYRCDKEGLVDLSLAFDLLQLNPYEPVYMLTLDRKPLVKTPDEFKEVAEAIGHYHYEKRREYWNAITDNPREMTRMIRKAR